MQTHDVRRGDQPPAEMPANRMIELSRKVRAWLERYKYYPLSAQRRGIEGVVEVAFELSQHGKANNVVIVRGSGYPILDHAALDSVGRAQPFPVDEGRYRFRLRFHRL